MRIWKIPCALLLIALPKHTLAAPSKNLIRKTERALVDQFTCKARPEVAKSINAMLKNSLVRYKKGSDGEFIFAPTVPMKFLGFRIRYITAYDSTIGFRKAPPIKSIFGGTPFHNIQIDVRARASQLRRRARKAGMIESWTTRDHTGLEIDSDPSNLAPKTRYITAKIRCVAW